MNLETYFNMRNCVVAALLVSCVAAHAENWGQWRGPAWNGSSPEQNLPETFSVDDADAKTKKQNVTWICDLPGASNATPVVFDDKVFVSSNSAGGSEMLGICIDCKTGKILWQKSVVKTQAGQVSGTGKNTNASPSPVTDGKKRLLHVRNGRFGLL